MCQAPELAFSISDSLHTVLLRQFYYPASEEHEAQTYQGMLKARRSESGRAGVQTSV